MSTQNTVIGILAGALVGGIAGILMAPDKGEKTRKKLAKKAKKTQQDLTENIDTVLENLSEKIDTIKKAGNNIIEKNKADFSKAKQDIKA